MENKKTTAHFKYRTYVPHNMIAFCFAHLYFFGEDKDKLEEAWWEIEKQTLEKALKNKVSEKIEEKKEFYEECKQDTEKSLAKLKNKRFALFKQKRIKSLEKWIKNYSKIINNIPKEMEEEVYLTDEEEAWELKPVAEQFLESLNAILIQHTAGEDKKTSEIYEIPSN